jgi:DNA-binding transcriptional LysR family regulator
MRLSNHTYGVSLLELRNIEAFLAIVQNKSFTEAAKVLSITQSTISLRIKSLEQELNTVLLDRNNGKTLVLTPEGEIAYPLFQQAYQLVNSVPELLKTTPNFIKSINISYPIHMSNHLLPKMSILNEKFPKMDFSLKIGNSSKIVDNVRNGWIDSGFVYSESPINSENCSMFPISEEDTVLVCSPDHYLLKEMPLSITDLTNERIIFYNKKMLTYKLVDNYLKHHGLQEYNMIEIQSINSIKDMVTEGQGIAFLQKVVVKEELNNKSLFELKLKDPLPKTNIYFVVKNNYFPQEIIDVIIQTAKGIYNNS